VQTHKFRVTQYRLQFVKLGWNNISDEGIFEVRKYNKLNTAKFCNKMITKSIAILIQMEHFLLSE
jgi:hypothetical protein